MGSRGGGGSNGGGVQGIPAASRKMVQSLKEIVNGVSDAEIYSALKDCNMDPNEAVNRLLSQDPFHEVKSKREKKKELKDTTEARPRGGGSTSTRGGRSSTDRYSARGGSSQYNSSESGGLHGKSKRENGTSSYTNSYTSSSAPTYGVTATNTNRIPQTYSSSVGYENKASNFSATDGTTTVPQQPSSGYQSAWLGAPGQKSMADIVKMGKPQNKPYTQPQSTHYEDYVSKPIDTHQEHDSGADNFVSPDDDWPVMEQSQPVGVQSVSEPHVESENIGQSNSQYIGSQIDDDVQEEDESGFEDQTTNHVQDNDVYKNNDSFYQEDHAFEHKEVEENDASASSISGNMQQLNIQEEKQLDESEEEIPSVVIPNHLQVQTADCSHLSFGSFGATMNQGYSGNFSSQQLVEPNTSSVEPSEPRNSEYYNDESIENNAVHRVGPNSGNYDLPTASQTEVLKQENPQVTPGNQYSYTFDSTQLLNQSFPHSQTTQLPNATPFSNVMQGAYTNSLPNTLLAANGRESDLSYSQFPISQSMATKYGSSVSPITGSTISMAEALKTGVFSSSSQQTQQTPAGNTIPTGPTLPQHLAVHPYSQQPLPLTPFTNMIYPFLPQSYTYMPSGFQQAFAAGNSTYHQQLAAVLPQYKNSVSVTQSAAAVPSGYGSFGNSATIPGNYQVNQPAGSTLSYDDVLSAHYKESSQLLSLQQQQNDNSAMWVHGAGSRTMSGMPASTYYGFQGQTQQQPTGFRQGQQQQLQQQQQQPTQSYGGQAAAHNYPNYYHSQSGISQEHQLQQNPRDSGSLVGGQPKPQQQLWQNSY